MPDVLAARLSPYLRRGLLLDSNLLLLYVVARTDLRLVRSFKRTRSFTLLDARLLSALVSLFDSLITTPHVLTEVNGLTNALSGVYKPNVRTQLAMDIPGWDERHIPAVDLVKTLAFTGLGLTDAALASLSQSKDGPLLLSTDGALVQLVAGARGAADSFATYQHLLAQR